MKQRKQGGQSSTDLILSSMRGSNADLFPVIANLYLKPGWTVADVTYGKGVFWKQINTKKYHFLPSDIATGIDCRHLPYTNDTIDAVIFDPPYMESSANTAYKTGQTQFAEYYGLTGVNGKKNRYYGGVLDIYREGAKEVWRVLKSKGVYIVKCQDEVCANKQRLNHVEIVNFNIEMGFVVEDLFVLIRNNRPVVSRLKKQVHARKNHSYFLVFRKP